MRNRIEVLMQWDPEAKKHYWVVYCVHHMGPHPDMTESKCLDWYQVTNQVEEFMGSFPPNDE